MHQLHLLDDLGPAPSFCSMWVPTLHPQFSLSIASPLKALARELQEIYIMGVLMLSSYKQSHRALGLDVCVFTL